MTNTYDLTQRMIVRIASGGLDKAYQLLAAARKGNNFTLESIVLLAIIEAKEERDAVALEKAARFFD